MVSQVEETERKRPRRRTRIALWTGVGLLLAGVAMLAWAGWEYYGTTWVSQRHYKATVADLEQTWASPPPSGTTATGSVHTRWGDATAIVRIPRFGTRYAVPVLEGTSSTQLANGFGHYAGSVGPGEVGNYALAGHRTTHGEPLRGMADLRVGDEVVVETRDATYTYRLITSGTALTVLPDATWVATPLPSNPDGGVEPPQEPGERLLTMTTCTPEFFATNRLVVFGMLVDTVQN